ncbi:MAG: hybrid sensor histidine kinase/response regulator [Oligoflexia bacterium]|nr:hybrid sensor histidine kinase/response regulator [Oligoflexia bacterium]
MEGKRPKILIVDDMKVNIMILEKYLSKERYDIYGFVDPLEALRRMDEISPDIFLLDIEMDELDGFELCQKIRENPNTQNTPVIFITSLDDTESLERALYVGGTEFLNKDMNPYELELRINNILKICFLTTEIREKNLQLEQKTESYKILVRLLCHDIANPLTTQGLHLERLKNLDVYKNDPVVLKSVSAISKSLEHILSIIDHVRQISAVEDGKVSFILTPVSVTDVFEELKFIFEERLRNKNIELLADPVSNPKLQVIADRTGLIHQVFANLISNAIKFSFEGQKITLGCEEKENEVIIKIRDNGIGVPDDLLPHLFKAHVKTSRPGTNKEKGTGFGLPLVKSYVEKYGGEILVTSAAKELFPNDHGTTFSVILKKVKSEKS